MADAYDAMVSERPHRPPLTSDEALSELRANAGGRFDPEAVRAMIEVDRQMNTTATVLEFPGKTG